jgi:hypothetical protein
VIGPTAGGLNRNRRLLISSSDTVRRLDAGSIGQQAASAAQTLADYA